MEVPARPASRPPLRGTTKEGCCMTAWSRLISLLLVTVLLGGPLASLAGAQQPAQPPAPDLFQESLKAERSTSQQSSAYDAGAIVTNVFLVPGRAITCGL